MRKGRKGGSRKRGAWEKEAERGRGGRGRNEKLEKLILEDLGPCLKTL